MKTCGVSPSAGAAPTRTAHLAPGGFGSLRTRSRPERFPRRVSPTVRTDGQKTWDEVREQGLLP